MTDVIDEIPATIVLLLQAELSWCFTLFVDSELALRPRFSNGLMLHCLTTVLSQSFETTGLLLLHVTNLAPPTSLWVIVLAPSEGKSSLLTN